MSNMSIREYFPFSRVKITKQSVLVEDKLAMISMEPDNRFTPICHICGTPAKRVHSRDVRTIRDLSLALVVIRLICWFRTVYCAECDSFVVEDLEFVRPYQRVTRRLAKYIHELCKVMTVIEVADHYENKVKKDDPEVEHVIQVVDVSEKYKDIIREIIPYTLKTKKKAIADILDRNHIDYVWE